MSSFILSPETTKVEGKQYTRKYESSYDSGFLRKWKAEIYVDLFDLNTFGQH